MRAFLRQQLEAFLGAVDAALAEPFVVVVIGGSAAALHYGVVRATHDIDTWTNVEANLELTAKGRRALAERRGESTLFARGVAAVIGGSR